MGMSDYTVERMTKNEIKLAVDWAAREGWNPGLHDADCFHAIDPNGFFKGELNGETIGCASALIYDDHFAFCGFYIVHPDHRASGYGIQITRARLDYIGDRNAGLDGVIDMQDKYARLGYRMVHRSIRYAYTPTESKESAAEIVPVSNVPFDQLVDFDENHFFARRESFLNCWLNQPTHTALALVDDGTLKGYGVIRKCETGHKIGPLFADDAEVAESLYLALCNHGLNAPVYLDIPEPNAAGMDMAKRYGMDYVFECGRMYLKGDPGLPLQNIFGITTFEAG